MTEWKVESIGDVCSFITDGSHNPPKGISQSEYFMLSSKDIQDGHLVFNKPRFLSEKDFEIENNRTKLQLDDVLLTTVGTIGRTAIYKGVPAKVTFQRSVSILRPMREKITPQYLKYFFDSITHVLTREARGVAQQGIYLNQLKRIQISYPPLLEQRKIVELLEDHLSRLDAALADVKQAKLKAAQFRRAFIHEMTTSVEGSEVMNILEICDVYQPKTISRQKMKTDGEFEVYGANGVIGRFDQFNHEEAEVLLSCRGNCGTVNVSKPRSWINGNAMVFSPKDNRIQKGYLEYVLRGMDWTPVITGTAQPQITRTSIKDVFINLPSPEIQHEIYMKLESALTQVTNASILSETIESQGESLRRSLLNAAFTGQLTKEVASV